MQQTFSGKWITTADFAGRMPRDMYHKEFEAPHYRRDEDHEPYNVHVWFRKEFALNKRDGRYILRVSADDYGKYCINGIFVGQGPTPGYIEAYHYHEFDVTEQLCEGNNIITAHVYYQGLINRVWISGDLRMGLIADLLDPDGSAIVVTDETWEYAPISNYTGTRKLGYDTQYLEDYDSRIPLGEYRSVAVRQYDDIVFWTAPTAALAVYDVTPQSVIELPQGGIFYDFGTEITATLNITAKGKRGDRIVILCGEELDDSPERVRHKMRCDCHYQETWILDDGEETLEQYDYKAFRYVTLVPSSSDVVIGNVVAVVRHAPFDDDACTLTCEDRALESVFSLCKNGVKYGTQEVYVDCPTREKGQYAGDMTVTSGAQLWLTGDISMLEKGILDHVRSANICKGLMAVLSGSFMQEIADYSLQFPLLLERHYQFAKDREFLSSMIPVAEGMFAHFERYAREDGLLDGVRDKWNLVDWPEEARDDYDFPLPKPVGPGTHNVLNAFYVGSVLTLERLKDVLGIVHDDKGKRLVEAFNRAFFRPAIGRYVDTEQSAHSSLHANMLAPFFGFVPAGYEKSVGDFLVAKGMACGVYMSYFLMRGLCRLGYYEAVYDLITSTGENSWYNMIQDGATTCMEAWGKDKKDNTSFCHPWSSAPITVLIEDLLSVSYDGTIGELHLPTKAGGFTMKIPTAQGTVTICR